jgi:hypothetical protein
VGSQWVGRLGGNPKRSLPIEDIWAIIRQRIRRRIFDSEEEMKEALQQEWDRITLEEIRHRIADMPRRYTELVRSNGGSIRGNKW